MSLKRIPIAKPQKLPEHRRRRGPGFGGSEVNLGADYSRDELEFMRALDRYKRDQRRPFPTCCEVLEVLRSLGYEKPAKAAATDIGLRRGCPV